MMFVRKKVRCGRCIVLVVPSAEMCDVGGLRLEMCGSGGLR